MTLAWQVKGDTSESYQFVVEVKEFDVAKNPNIKGIEKEFNQDTTRTTISDLKSGTTYSATIRAVDLDKSNYGGSSTSVVFTTSKFIVNSLIIIIIFLIELKIFIYSLSLIHI